MLTNTDNFQLKKTIGSSWITDEDDVQKTKSALKETGDYKTPDWGITGIPDQEMFDGLKSFQKKEGLKVDGVMKPGGPTEERLRQTTQKARTGNAKAQSNLRKRTGNNVSRGIAEGEWDWDRPVISALPGRAEPKKSSRSSWPEVDWLKTPPFNHSPNTEEHTGRRRGTPDRDRSRDVQVALAPLIPAILAGGAALMRYGPKALRGSEKIVKGAPPLIGAAEQARKQSGKPTNGREHYPSPIPQPPEDENSKPKRANIDSADPLLPTPDFEASDMHMPDREEFPEERDFGPTTEIFPNPGQREAILETFPIDDSLSQWIIMENSRGAPDIQAKNEIMVELITDAFAKNYIPGEHMFGSRTAIDKEYKKERFLRAINGIGAARPDGSFRIAEKEWIDFNTVDNLKDGRTPDAREGRGIVKIGLLHVAHGENSEIWHFPKLKGMGLDEWREEMKPLVDEYVRKYLSKK